MTVWPQAGPDHHGGRRGHCEQKALSSESLSACPDSRLLCPPACVPRDAVGRPALRGQKTHLFGGEIKLGLILGQARSNQLPGRWGNAVWLGSIGRERDGFSAAVAAGLSPLRHPSPHSATEQHARPPPHSGQRSLVLSPGRCPHSLAVLNISCSPKGVHTQT